MSSRTFVISGLTNTFYVTDEWDCGANNEFVIKKKVGEKHSLYGYERDSKQLIAIHLSDSEGQCCSGWCTATFADIKIDNVNRFPSFSFIPTKHLEITLDINKGSEEINCKCEAFSFSEFGGDGYYPSGYYSINYDVFKTTPRYSDKRVVYVFQGPSGIGKSFITGKLDNSVTVFETDSCNELPSVIYEDIVVLGNKHGYSLDDIKSRLFKDPIVRICKMD